MSWDVQWSFPAEQQLRSLRTWKNAERVASAVHGFAATGEGTVVKVPDRPGELRLLMPPFEVRFSLDVGNRVLHVWAVYRRQP
jgi:hypothetical protein